MSDEEQTPVEVGKKKGRRKKSYVAPEPLLSQEEKDVLIAVFKSEEITDTVPTPIKSKESQSEDLFKLSAVQFSKTRGLRSHQSAGFLNEASRLFGLYARKTRTEWAEAFTAFQNRPTGPKR